MKHQQVTKLLGAAGLKAKVMTRRVRRPGYEVSQLGGAVGVICGPYSVEEVSRVLIDSGLRVYQKPNASRDAVFAG